MRKGSFYVVSAFLGALGLAAAAAETQDVAVAAVIGAGIGLVVAFVFHIYPDDIAPPADRRHEATQRRKASAKP